MQVPGVPTWSLVSFLLRPVYRLALAAQIPAVRYGLLGLLSWFVLCPWVIGGTVMRPDRE